MRIHCYSVVWYPQDRRLYEEDVLDLPSGAVVTGVTWFPHRHQSSVPAHWECTYYTIEETA